MELLEDLVLFLLQPRLNYVDRMPDQGRGYATGGELTKFGSHRARCPEMLIEWRGERNLFGPTGYQQNEANAVPPNVTHGRSPKNGG